MTSTPEPTSGLTPGLTADRPLVMLGCGNMGGALLACWLEAGLNGEAVLIVDPSAASQAWPAIPAANIVADAAALPRDRTPGLILLAIKPQLFDQAIAGLPALYRRAPVLSIMAGIPSAQIARTLQATGPVIRSMPNTPVRFAQGLTGLWSTTTDDAIRALVSDLFMAAGQAVWVDAEDDLHAVTGIAGSAPAYVFHFVEVLAAAGAAQGLDAEQAMVMARQTLIGAAALLQHDPADAASLRRQVTSKAGTTAAALDVLMRADGGLRSLVDEAVAACVTRSRELAE